MGTSAELLSQQISSVRPRHWRKSRVVRGLEHAELWTGRPPYKDRRLRGAAARGLAYERRVGKYLYRRTRPRANDLRAQLLQGPWIRYEDAHGYGAARPDHVLVQPGLLWIIECKLTHTGAARSQLLDLYLPLCSTIWPNRGVVCIQAAYNSNGASVDMRELDDIYTLPDRDYYVWHWMR